MARPRILIFGMSLTANYGGAASQCAWLMQALRDDHELHFLSPDATFDCTRVNRLYGTSFREGDVRAVGGRLPGWLLRLPTRWLKTVRLAFLAREVDAIAPAYDLVIATVNELRLGTPALQIINCPVRSDALLRELYPPAVARLRMMNNRLYSLVSGEGGRDFHPSTEFFVISEWTAAAFRRAYGREARVMYPPVASVPRQYHREWHEREPGFVVIGRLAPDKRVHEAIEIIDRLRADFPEVHLHIVGSGKGSYARRIEALAARRPYVRLERGISRDELNALLGSHRFGLHTTRTEHFGIAPAEILSAGAIAFVHDSGGQVEIVDRDPRLVYRDRDDAVAKIRAVMGNGQAQDELRTRLVERSLRFDTERSMREVREHVTEALAGRGGKAG